MRVPDEIKECVVFIAVKKGDDAGGDFVLIGSAFIWARPSPVPEMKFTYLVTAAHILQEATKELLVDEVWVRFQMVNNIFEWRRTLLSDWKFHPTRSQNVDVAVFQITGLEGAHLRSIGDEHLMTPEVVKELDIGIGDEVFIMGLFQPRAFLHRTVPILRMGTIAGMDEEPILTKGHGRIAAYLIEIRSIGGISGSPVFFHRLFGGRIYFLGLIHGHFDSDQYRLEATTDRVKEQGINTGIAVVVPWSDVVEVIDQFLESERLESRKITATKFLDEQIAALAVSFGKQALERTVVATLEINGSEIISLRKELDPITFPLLLPNTS